MKELCGEILSTRYRQRFPKTDFICFTVTVLIVPLYDGVCQTMG